MRKTLTLLFLSLILTKHNFAQTGGPWQGKKCAVVLTYDDAIDQHLDNAVPVLDSLGLTATFYITANSISVRNRMKEWKALADRGYELGNHTLYHPCMGGPDRAWVRPEYDLKNYTVQQMVEEMRMTNTFLQALDGKSRRTFAYTCGDMKVGDSLFMNGMKKDFVAARAVRNEMHKINEIDLYSVDCFVVNGESSAQLIGWAKKAMETNSLLVVLFHCVGGGNALNVVVSDHREFLKFLKQNEKDMMITTLINVSDYIRTTQGRN